METASESVEAAGGQEQRKISVELQVVQRAILRRIDMCCSAVMTATAHDTAEGVVVMAAGGAADDLRWSCSWGAAAAGIDRVMLQLGSSGRLQ